MATVVDLTTGPETIPASWTRVGPLVAYQFDPDGLGAHLRHGGLVVWHWCDHNRWRGRAHFDAHPELYPPRWVPSGVAHRLVSAEPLHLEPSVYWPDCCGLHGFIRDGTWIGA